MKIFYLILSFFILITSCKKEDKKPLNNQINQTIDSLYFQTLDSLTIYLNKFNENKLLIISQLKNIKGKEANKLYKNYLKDNQQLLTQINGQEVPLLDNFYTDDKRIQNLLQDETIRLKKYGLEMEELGEGYVEINTIHDFYYTIFKDNVTPDYKEYLNLTCEENKTLYAADAGLVISFKDLGDRIISWEKFIENYPNSDLLNEVKESKQYYQLDYIFGLDNTPTTETYDKDNIYIYDENKEEFQRFITKYPDSPTTELVKYYMENYKKEGIIAEIRAKIYFKSDE